jgi:hypothetical protein
MNYNNKSLKTILPNKLLNKSSFKSSNNLEPELQDELAFNFLNTTNIRGIDTYGSKTDQSQVEKSDGYPTLSRYRCCDEQPYLGTPLELLESEPASISGYGFAQYSDITKCAIVSNKKIKDINEEIEENNINVDDPFDRKFRKAKNRKANLGKDVISYRIKSSKE